MDPLETLAGEELDALLLSTLSHAEKCALIRSRLGDVAGKPVRACWLERPASREATTFSALMQDGELYQGLCLPRAESAAEGERVGLLDLPRELLVSVLHRLEKLKDVVAVVNTCRTLRNVAFETRLRTLTHIDESNLIGRYSARRTVSLLSVIGPCVESLTLDFVVPSNEVDHQLTLEMPHLVSIHFSSPPAALLEQLVALAPLRVIKLYEANIPWKTLDCMQRIPLEEVNLASCKVDLPADRAVADKRLAITLQKVTLRSVAFCSLTASEDASQGLDWQGPFVVVSLHQSHDFILAELFFSRHLTHLHLDITAHYAHYVQVLPLFENAAFSLEQLCLSIDDIKCLKAALHVVIRRNPELEVLVAGRPSDGSWLISSTPLDGIPRLTRLRFPGLDNVDLGSPETVVNWLSMPSFRFLALSQVVKPRPILLQSVSALSNRIPEWHALIQVKKHHELLFDYCSHLNFEQQAASTCRVCEETLNAECCFRAIRSRPF